ncbi:MAG: glycoside hydrolase family 172 protein [Ruthenibacterium sp.]
MDGHSIDDLFLLQNCKTRRAASDDKTGGNHDWLDLPAGEIKTFAQLEGCGIVRHIWMTHWTGDENWTEEPLALRKLVLRIYWDDEQEPSVEVPLGDFFGIGFGMRKCFSSAALQMNPEDGRGMNCYFPMPFRRNARFTIESNCLNHTNFYFYIDYELMEKLPENAALFHACWHREVCTDGWAPKEPGLLDREKANVPEEPAWIPKAWLTKNVDGADNYVILQAEGKGKYVGCNLNVDVFEPQCNEWYGEGDDMIFVDGELLLRGTGTEDYFNTAFCPTTTYATPYSGLTVYSGDASKPHKKFAGKNSMYRLHINEPVHFEKSIRVTVEHGHANKLSNDYSSTAYWYQTEPHAAFEPLPMVTLRMPRR